MSKIKLEEYIERYKKNHNNKYDYSLVTEINHRIKMKVVCPIHGIFEQLPYNHMKQGCPNCAGVNKKSIISFYLC